MGNRSRKGHQLWSVTAAELWLSRANIAKKEELSSHYYDCHYRELSNLFILGFYIK